MYVYFAITCFEKKNIFIQKSLIIISIRVSQIKDIFQNILESKALLYVIP